MAEPSTAIEAFKLMATIFLGVRNAILSIKFMSFCMIISAICAFLPLSWWERVKMPKVAEFCKTYYEFSIIIFVVAIVVMIILYVDEIVKKRKRQSDFEALINNLNPVEMKALCNAYHNGGKYSLPSCYAELESLRSKSLIVVSSESGSFGGQEFTLSHEVYMYINRHKEFFTKLGIEPDPPDEDKVPFCAVV